MSISPAPAPQVRGPFNCVPSGSLAAACFAVRALTDPRDPDQWRLLPPDHAESAARAASSIRVEPAPVNARTATIKRITGSILGALAEALPERVPGGRGRARC